MIHFTFWPTIRRSLWALVLVVGRNGFAIPTARAMAFGYRQRSRGRSWAAAALLGFLTSILAPAALATVFLSYVDTRAQAIAACQAFGNFTTPCIEGAGNIVHHCVTGTVVGSHGPGLEASLAAEFILPNCAISTIVHHHSFIYPIETCATGTTFVGPTPGACEPIIPRLQPEKNFGCPAAATGNPCDPATGNKYQSQTDYLGANATPALVRHYNSQLTKDYGWGRGWTSSLHKRLEINQGAVQVRAGSGRGDPFTCASDSCTGDGESALTLTKDATGYTLTKDRGAIERYSVAGVLQQETDLSGRVTTYTYDEQGRLVTVTGPDGHTLTFGYDASNHIATVTTSAGQSYTYLYDHHGDAKPVRVNYPDGTATVYHHENSAFPNHLTGISYIEADNTTTRYATYAYDSLGKAIATEHAGGMQRYTLAYDTPTQTTVTDAVNTAEVMTFQTTLGVKNLIAKVNQADGKSLAQRFDTQNNLTCKKDEEGRVTTYTYNTTNQRSAMTEGLVGECPSPQTTSSTRTTTYEYVSPTLDLPAVVQSPSVLAGSLKRTEITYQGNLPKTLTQRGFTPAGAAVTRTVSLGYNAAGQVTSIDGPRTEVSDVTTLAYYECTTGGRCGQLQSMTNALGHVTTFDTYDANGRVMQMTDANGLRTTYTYDARGRVRVITETPPTGAARVSEYRYNAAGDVTFTGFPDGRTLTYTYDAARLLQRVTDNLGNYIAYGYDRKGNRTQEYTYDPANALARQLDIGFDARNRVRTINAAGALTQQLRDAVGNLTSETDPNNNSPTTHSYDALHRLLQTVNSLSGVTGYGYDVNDRLAQVNAPNNASTEYRYDDLGNLLQELSPDRGTTHYGYDSAGNVTSQTDARGITMSYTYDAANRLTQVTYPTAAENVSFTYDTGTTCTLGMGRLCQVVDESGTTQFAYDAFGNILTQRKRELAVTYVTAYAYDAGDRITSITYPDGRVVSYARDALRRLNSVTTTVNGAAQTIVSNRTYDADGLLNAQTFGNGLSESRQHNLKGELRNQSLGSADTRLYDYDLNGNLTRKESTVETAAYTYDALNRLLNETMASEANAFTYDGNGNRTSDLTNTGTPRAYTYASGTNRLTRLGAQTVLMDAAGNITSDRNGNRRFTYDSAGHLRTVTRQGVLRGTYTYNYLNQRTQKVRVSHTGATARFVYHYDVNGYLIAETRPNGRLVRAYVWADNEPIAQIQNRPTLSTEELVYLHVDHLQTPRLATNATQTVVWRFESEAFGTGRPDIDPDENEQATHIRLTLSRGYRDGESGGLIYVHHRYLDKNSGRWLTSDPIGLRGGLNTYAYVGNNPLRWVDPFGLVPCPTSCRFVPNNEMSERVLDRAVFETAHYWWEVPIPKVGGGNLRPGGSPSIDIQFEIWLFHLQRFQNKEKIQQFQTGYCRCPQPCADDLLLPGAEEDVGGPSWRDVGDPWWKRWWERTGRNSGAPFDPGDWPNPGDAPRGPRRR